MTDDSPGLSDLTPSLVVRLRQGDSTAAEMLRSIHGPAILRFCMGYLANEVEAQDAVQEVFVLTLRSDVVPENFRAWLYRVARNHCLKVLRTRRRKPPPGELPPESLLGDDITGNLTRMARDELKQRLNTLVVLVVRVVPARTNRNGVLLPPVEPLYALLRTLICDVICESGMSPLEMPVPFRMT